MVHSESKESIRLAELFSDIFILATSLKREATGNFGSPDALRHNIIEQFDKAEQKGRERGVSHEVLQHARYAATAFLDEVILSSAWSRKDEWFARPLQYEFFKEHEAGVEFYNRLETLRRAAPRDRNLLEVYYLCLILGFEGQYKLHRSERRKEIIGDLCRELQPQRGETLLLSPQGKRPDELMTLVKQGLPAWIVVVGSVAILFFFYLTLSFLLGRDTSDLVDDLYRFVEVKP